jgi:hypothetical protein
MWLRGTGTNRGERPKDLWDVEDLVAAWEASERRTEDKRRKV